jgi:hypothetical protein
MTRLRSIAGCLLLLLVARTVEAGNLFTNAVIAIAPGTLDFGSVRAGATATNTFLVENLGRARLVGKATVPTPFKILSGADYALGAGELQVVTITYTPSGAERDSATVKFTGGGGVEASVTGGLAVPTSKKPQPRYRAGPVQD